MLSRSSMQLIDLMRCSTIGPTITRLRFGPATDECTMPLAHSPKRASKTRASNAPKDHRVGLRAKPRLAGAVLSMQRSDTRASGTRRSSADHLSPGGGPEIGMPEVTSESLTGFISLGGGRLRPESALPGSGARCHEDVSDAGSNPNSDPPTRSPPGASARGSML